MIEIPFKFIRHIHFLFLLLHLFLNHSLFYKYIFSHNAPTGLTKKKILSCLLLSLIIEKRTAIELTKKSSNANNSRPYIEELF